MALSDLDRYNHIEAWAAKQDQADPGWKQRVQHKFLEKLRKWKKPRNIAGTAYKGVMVMCPPGLSHAIDWGVEKGTAKLQDRHHKKKAASAAAKYANDPAIDREGKELKHKLKESYKQFDTPAKKVRDALAEFEKLRKPAQIGDGACISAKNLMRKFAYYEHRVEKMREAADEAAALMAQLDSWLKLNEDFIRDMHNPFSDGGIIDVVQKVTDHPHFFCHDSKCVNWTDADTAQDILDRDLALVHGATQSFGRGKGYQKL